MFYILIVSNFAAQLFQRLIPVVIKVDTKSLAFAGYSCFFTCMSLTAVDHMLI